MSVALVERQCYHFIDCENVFVATFAWYGAQCGSLTKWDFTITMKGGVARIAVHQNSDGVQCNFTGQCHHRRGAQSFGCRDGESRRVSECDSFHVLGCDDWKCTFKKCADRQT